MKAAVLAAALGAALAGCGPPDGGADKAARKAPPPVGAREGESAPVLDLLDSRGARFRTSSWIGRRAQLLVMGTTQCPRCEGRMAEIEQVRARFGESLEIAAILFSETGDRAEAFAARHKAGFRMVLDPQNTGIVLYKPGAYPHFVLIDKQGVIRYTGPELPGDARLIEAARAEN